MSDVLDRELEHVRVLRPEPGDVIIATVHEGLTCSPEHAMAIKEHLESEFGGYRVIVMVGADLSVVRGDDGEKEAPTP